MKYGIIANPVSGPLNLREKQIILEEVAEILGDCTIHGLDTTSKEEFCQEAIDLSDKVETLVVAGGDGTASDIFNTVNEDTLLSYLPLGSGNLLSYALGLPYARQKIAKKIRDGEEHHLDLILCQGKKKAMVASIGIDSTILEVRDGYIERGTAKGLFSYVLASGNVLSKKYESGGAILDVNAAQTILKEFTSIIISKVPYFGYGLKVVPKAKFDDGQLHVLASDAGRWGMMYGALTSLIGENKVGAHTTAHEVRIITTKPYRLQCDGTLEEKPGTSFSFKVLPGALKMKY